MIEFRDVTVCYEKGRLHPVPSLEHLSLTIGSGELVFLVGPSGAGKSTLLKLVNGEVKPDGGGVVIDGEDISQFTVRELPPLRQKIGVIFQDFQLLSQKTAWENVAFALRVIGVPQSRIVKEVPRALDTVGVAHRSHAYPHELSGGEQQRVAIARAIVNAPRILLADEPTGNLDPETAIQIGELLERINRELGTTILMVTHDRTLVDSMARRVVRLGDGRLISDENPGRYALEEIPTPPDAATRSPEPVRIFPVSPAPAAVQDATAVHDEAEIEPVSAVERPVSPAGERREAGPGADPEVVAALDNEAPIGSPENPIVSYER